MDGTKFKAIRPSSPKATAWQEEPYLRLTGLIAERPQEQKKGSAVSRRTDAVVKLCFRHLQARRRSRGRALGPTYTAAFLHPFGGALT